MKVLTVIAHPNPESFNHAILQSFSKGAAAAGHEVESLDLYADDFDPLFKLPDFAPYTGGELPDDVKAQQARIAEADALILVYPVWWYAGPAIMKGWFDRVFTMGFAFGFGEKGPVGLLKELKVMHLRTTMGGEEEYSATGVEDAMRKLAQHELGTVCGAKEVIQKTFYNVHGTDEERKAVLAEVFDLGKSI